MRIFHTVLFLLLCIVLSYAQRKTENVVLITLDGFRWQELFGGGVDSLMNDCLYVKDTAALQSLFAAPTKEERRAKLLPWFWTTIGQEGQIYGNRLYDNKVNCSNVQWFSYPGYNEILTGYSDPYVNSNEKKYNKNITVLEWLHQQKEFSGRVAAFGSWDVFHYIINDERSGIPVNTGTSGARGHKLTEKEQFLNKIQHEIPALYGDMRWDVFTHHFALEYMQRHHPRVVYIAYGETDDFAHDSKYDQYLYSAHQTDAWLRQLWNYLQSDRFYQGKTTMLITTDHGRGTSPKEEWKSHGKIFKGSPEMWMAVIGPDTPPRGEIRSSGQLFQNQVAETLARFLGYDYESELETGNCIEAMMMSEDAYAAKR